MDRQALIDESPKVFQALARFLSPTDLTLLNSDYQATRQLGGNIEHGLEREQGVLYNPRLARVLSIMATDLGITDSTTLRAALYAAVFHSGLGAVRSAIQDNPYSTPPELEGVVAAALDRDSTGERECSIRGAIALDAVRHLHQTAWEFSQRQSFLSAVEETILCKIRGNAAEILVQKLEHAINLQQRRLTADETRT
jgi:hypothetical protein